MSHAALWPLGSGHHNKEIRWLEALVTFSPGFGSVSHQRLPASSSVRDQRDVTRVRVRVTDCSHPAFERPAAASPRAERAPLKLWKCKNYDQLAQSLGDV